MRNLKEMDESLVVYDLPKLSLGEVNDLNGPIKSDKSNS